MSSLRASEVGADRRSEAPLCIVLSGASDAGVRPGLVGRLPATWVSMSSYLIGGVVLGLVLILGLSLGRSGDAPATAPRAAAMVTDNITRLHARDIGESCWQGIEKDGPTRLTATLEVGLDGKVRYAAASGETHVMRSCVEAHVKSWQFLPQLQPTTMALPFEVDRR